MAKRFKRGYKGAPGWRRSWMMLSGMAFAAAGAVGQSKVPAGAARPPVVQPAGDALLKTSDLLNRRSLLNYDQPVLPAMSFTDSPGDVERAHLLVEGDTIHLSIRDAIALALENNLDVESVRLLKPMALADMARARSGQLLRNLPSALEIGAASAAGTLATASPFGYEGSTVPGGVLSGLIVQLAGSPIPNTEPVLFASGRVYHDDQPQANRTVTGTNFLNTKEEDWQLGMRKGFFTGTNLTVQFDSFRTSQNAPFNSINPAIAADASVRVEQHLLQGFGRRTNMRAIHIARNNGQIADFTFRQQVILTVSQVLGLYYDLVSFQDQAKVIAEALDRSKQQLDTVRQRMDMGLIPESDLIAQQIEITAKQQALTDARAQIAAQEATLKSAITHAGLDDPHIAKAHLELTDSYQPPPTDASAVDPAAIADRAVAQRSEIKQGELGLANKHLSLLGTRNSLRPTFDVYVSLENNALAGRLNSLAPAGIVQQTDPTFIGGFGTVLDQLALRSYPDYEVGFHLNLPIVNRAAQSDMARDQMDLRQQEISQQSLRNGIRLQATKSALALQQARRQYELSVESLQLQQKILETEQKMFDFGNSDPEHLAAAQLGVDRALLKKITSLDTYARARVNLDAVLEETLVNNDILLDNPAKPVR